MLLAAVSPSSAVDHFIFLVSTKLNQSTGILSLAFCDHRTNARQEAAPITGRVLNNISISWAWSSPPTTLRKRSNIEGRKILGLGVLHHHSENNLNHERNVSLAVYRHRSRAGHLKTHANRSITRLTIIRYKMCKIHYLRQSTQRGPRQRVTAEPPPIPFALCDTAYQPLPL